MTQNQNLMLWQTNEHQLAQVEIIGKAKPLNGKEFMKVKVVKVLSGVNEVRVSLSIGEVCEVVVNNLKSLQA